MLLCVWRWKWKRLYSNCGRPTMKRERTNDSKARKAIREKTTESQCTHKGSCDCYRRESTLSAKAKRQMKWLLILKSLSQMGSELNFIYEITCEPHWITRREISSRSSDVNITSTNIPLVFNEYHYVFSWYILKNMLETNRCRKSSKVQIFLDVLYPKNSSGPVDVAVVFISTYSILVLFQILDRCKLAQTRVLKETAIVCV